MPHALGVDVGTTNVKVALVDGEGRLVGGASRPVPTIREDGRAEQDPEALWGAVVDGAQEVTAAAPGAAGDVASIGVCSQYSSIVPVGSDGAALAPFVLHMDRRGTARSWDILNRHEEAFALWVERHGIPPVGSGLSLGHVLWFQHERPDLHDATMAYLEPMDFVGLRLTGEVTATQCSQFTSQLCDNRTLGVTSYDPDLVALSGVDVDRMPPLIAPDGVVGEVRPEVADALGINRGAMVAAGMNDSQAGAFATGAFTPGRAGLMVGTTAVLLDAVDHHGIDLDHEIVSMPSPVPGQYLAWAENGIAGRAVEHVLVDLLAVGADPFGDLDEVVSRVPAGSDGVLFLPWLTGSLAPRAATKMRGGFLNLSLDTTRNHLVRAMLEGTAYNVAWLLPAVEGFTGNEVTEVVFGGGAARSPAWAQILADVLGRPVRSLMKPDTAVARAVAGAAMRATGAGGPPVEAEPEASGAFVPDPNHRDLYDLLGEQFVAAFDAVRPIAEAVSERLDT